MDRYFIEEVKRNCEGGCGPCCGPSVTTTSIKYKNDDNSYKWLSVIEVDGMLSFYTSDCELFGKLVEFSGMTEEDDGYDECWNLVNEEYLTEFEDIELTNDECSDYYDDIFSEIEEETYAVMLLKYAICVSGCVYDKLDSVIKAASGKYIDEIEYDRDDAWTEIDPKYQ